MIEQFWIFHCGYLRAPAGAIVRGGGFQVRRLPFLAALAFHEEHGPVLVDAPFGHEGPANAGEVVGALLRGAGQKFKPSWAIVPRIEQLGYRASEVNHILMTHLHWDHTGGMKELAHATFHIERLEWEEATRLKPVDAARQGFAPGDYRALGSRVQMLDLVDEVDIAGGFDVFGDGSVQAVPLPGHTLGHTGYRFHLTDGRSVFFLGDAVFTVGQVTKRQGLGVYPRVAAFSAATARDTIRKLRTYHAAMDDPEHEVLICSHDFDWGERCMNGPAPVHEM